MRCKLANLDAVLLTHGHLDHTGRLPLLVRDGYRGPIYCTKATIEMAMLILRDAARLQQSEVQRINRKRAHTGERPDHLLCADPDTEIFAHRLAEINDLLDTRRHGVERPGKVLVGGSDQREVLVLRHFEELTFPLVAERMNRSVDSVKKLWPRALANLRQLIRERWHESEQSETI